MRTDDEILARIEAVKERDFFGFERTDYIARLPFDKAKPYLIEKVNEKDWEHVARDPEIARIAIREYMPFAWDKANRGRGISSNRSIGHMIAWTWLAGDEGICRDLEQDLYGEVAGGTGYCFYGKPQLVKVCRYYGIDWQDLDDGRWSNTEDGPGYSPEEALAKLQMEAP